MHGSRARGVLARAAALVAAGLALLPASSASAQEVEPVRIAVDAATVEGPISPMLYGQFLEFMFGGIKEGLTAELIRDRGFDESPNAIGLPRDWNRYPDDRNDDYALAFRWDDSVAYPVAAPDSAPRPDEHALRVRAGDGVIPRHGIFQSRIPLRRRVRYTGHLWLKSGGYEGPVVVSLEADVVGGERYDEAEIQGVEGDWRRYEFTLVPDRSDPLARFAILFPGRGALWVDQVSLMPDDAVGVVRGDVAEKVAALNPAFLRWPGGNVAQDYHWMWGVGPRARRPAWVNLSWRDERETGDFGTREYVEFSRHVGAEPTITVNVEGRGATPAEAAAWVEYANGDPGSGYGALRADDGHPEPFDITYWELGNEIWGDWVRGHSDAETYAANVLRYHATMQAVDPTLRYIAVGDNDIGWNRTVLRRAGHLIDYLAIHHYYGRRPMAGDLRNLMARPLFYERFYGEMARVIREEVPDRTVRLAINEWGLDLPVGLQYSMAGALYGARLMNVFERSSPLVSMTAVSDLVNGWPGGIIQASRHGVFVSPLYHVQRMYADHLGAARLRTLVEGPTFDTSAEGQDVPVVDAVASRSADGRHVFVKVVNTDLERDMDLEIQVAGASIQPDGTLELLTAPDLSVRNSFREPEAIVPRIVAFEAADTFHLRIPRHSVGVLTLTVAQ